MIRTTWRVFRFLAEFLADEVRIYMRGKAKKWVTK